MVHRASWEHVQVMHMETDEPEDAIGFGETPCDDTLQRGHVTAGPRLTVLLREVAHLQQHVDGCDHIRTRQDVRDRSDNTGIVTNGVSFLQTNNTIVLTDLIVMVMPFLQAGRKRETLPCTEEPMITLEFITALFYHVDEQLRTMPKHPEAHLWPSELVTLGLLHALKGVGNRAFYRWLTRDYRPLFPRLPERTRLFRLFRTHQDWTQAFLATPTVLGVIDTYGIELIHPMREGRSPQQIGRKGLSNHRWIVGGKLCLLLNQYGLVVGW